MRTTNLTTRWYTTDFISNSLKTYLEDHGYRVLEETEQNSSNSDDVILASKFFGKELIEIRGTVPSNGLLREENENNKRAKLFTDAMHWLSEVLLSPITFFANHYTDAQNRSLCLPDTEQYRELLEKVKEYFTTNNLNLKVYLVSQSGKVHITYLNSLLHKDEEANVEVKG